METSRGDFISRIICEAYNVRVYTALTLDTVREIARLHGASPLASLLLARTVNAAALLSAGLKPGTDQNLTLKISCTGTVKELHAQADARGNIRAYAADPDADFPEDPSRVIGAGFLSVTRDLGRGEPYSGVTPLAAGDIARDVARYLTESEQVPSALILGVSLDENGGIDASGGILIQRFPDTGDEALARIEKNISSMDPSLGEILRKGGDIYSAASGLMDNNPLAILDTTNLRASCRCSRELLLDVIRKMSREDLDDMLQRDHGVELRCTFCTKKYYFGEDELR